MMYVGNVLVPQQEIGGPLVQLPTSRNNSTLQILHFLTFSFGAWELFLRRFQEKSFPNCFEKLVSGREYLEGQFELWVEVFIMTFTQFYGQTSSLLSSSRDGL